MRSPVGATCAFRYQGKTRPVSKEVVNEAGRVVRGLAEAQQLAELGREMATNHSLPPLPPVAWVEAAATGPLYASVVLAALTKTSVASP